MCVRLVPLCLMLSGCFEQQISEAYDRDADGFPSDQLGGPDCDDQNAAVYPGAVEICGNGLDDDCSGVVDDAGTGDVTFYIDKDGDGFPGTTPSSSCTAPEGSFPSLVGGADCDDTDPERSPGVREVWYDGIDQDCDGNDTDQDGDGFDGVSAGGDDCEDTVADVNPGMLEVCNNGVDDDCDGGAGRCALVGEIDAGELAVATLMDVGQVIPGLELDGQPDAVGIFGQTRGRVFGGLGAAGPFGIQSGAVWNLDSIISSASLDITFGDVSGDGVLDALVVGRSLLRVVRGPFVEGTYNSASAELEFDNEFSDDDDNPIVEFDPTTGGWLMLDLVFTRTPQLRYYSGLGVHSGLANGTPIGAPGVVQEVVARPGAQANVVVLRDGELTSWTLPGSVPTSWDWDVEVVHVASLPDTAMHFGSGALAVRWRDTSVFPTIHGLSIIDGEDVVGLDAAAVSIRGDAGSDRIVSVSTCDFDGDGQFEMMVGFFVEDAMRPWNRTRQGVAVFEDVPSGSDLLLADADYTLLGAPVDSLACVDANGDGRMDLFASDSWIGLTQVFNGREQ